MRPSSLVGRLVAAALVGMLAAGAAAAAIFGIALWLRDGDHPLDAELEEQLEDFARELRLDPAGRPVFQPRRSADMYDALRRDTAYRILDAGGRTVFSSLDGPALRALARLPPGAAAFEVRGDGEPVVLRVREREVVRAGNAYRIQVARSNRMEERLGEYARRLSLGAALAAVAVALAVFIVVVYATVRRTVVPLRRASATAAGIGPRMLSARLRVDGIPAEMAPLIDALNSALDRLEQGFRVQQEFLAMAAHELKTPLALLQAEIESGGDIDREAVLRDTRLMARQVHQLLHLAEASEGHNYRFSRLLPRALANDAVAYLDRLAARTGVRLRVVADGDAASIEADAGAVFVLLKNLLENAISHSPRGATVVLQASARGFAVEDRGAGVAPADREHLFKRFWRACGDGAGAGLGLAIVREICLAHQWTVRVEDGADGGARFVVSIPDAAARGGR